MKLMAFIPPHFKDLLQYVPTLLFELVDWTDLSKEFVTITKNRLNHNDFEKLKQVLQPLLPEPLSLTKTDNNAKSQLRKSELAKTILELYFLQVLRKGDFFLDLSQDRFQLQESLYHWNPSGLRTHFSPKFQEGIINIYAGFYNEKHEQFRQGLIECGLISQNWDENTKVQLEKLFTDHFGPSLNAPMSFKLSEFQASFHKIFEFLIHHKVTLHSDFLSLGVMLVTLYTHLETLNTPLLPKDIFQAAHKKLFH